MSWGSDRGISHHGLMNRGGVPFKHSTLVKNQDEGKPVKITAALTVALCDDDDVFDGVVMAIDATECTVRLTSFETLSYTGFPHLVPGVRDLVADAAGGVKNGSTCSAGTITVSVGVPAADGTVTIGTEVYTFKAARSAAFEVTIGASIDACVANIATAINTDSAIVGATADPGTDTVLVQAKVPGVGGNSIVFTENATNLVVDGAGTLGTTTAGAAGTGPKYLITDVDQTNRLASVKLK